MKLQGVMQSYINVIGAIIIAVWAVVVNMLMLMLMVYFCLQVSLVIMIIIQIDLRFHDKHADNRKTK